MTKQIILTVYFNGAWCEHYDTDNLAGFLFANTHTGESNNTLHAKMSFDGCMGYTGILFGNGTKAHVEAVKAYVISFLKKGYAVTLNVYGHSRGGVEALFLAKELSHFPKEEVSINLALMDPTPVNLFLTSELDKAYGFTWANQVMDLSACHNLAHLCAIYTNQPYNAGPSVQAIREQFMAPIFPKFPAQCKVQVEIIAGYHSQAQAINNDGWITNHHILTFLTDRGSVFNPTLSQNYSSDKLCQHYHAMLNFYRSATDCGPNATRSFHADQSFYIRTQLSKNTLYLNRSHKILMTQQADSNDDDCMLTCVPADFSVVFKGKSVAVEEIFSAQTVHAFINAVYENISAEEAMQRKGKMIFGLIQYLGEHLSDALDPQSLGNLLRNVLKIFLLHNRYNPFSQATRTGTLALTLLNQAPYQKIARKIKQEPLVYEDLMNYVTGTNDHQHFDSTHAEEVYTHLNDEISKNSYRCFLNKHPNAYWK